MHSPHATQKELTEYIYTHISLAFHRIFIESYRSMGYNFDITNHPVYDQQFAYGRNIFVEVSQLVDDILNEPDIKMLYPKIANDGIPLVKQQMNKVRKYYPSIPTISNSSNEFDEELSEAVIQFQKIFELKRDGKVSGLLQRRLSFMYKNVCTIDEIGNRLVIPLSVPKEIVGYDHCSDLVRVIQQYLVIISIFYNEVSLTNITGSFGAKTQVAVLEFQKMNGITEDGIVGEQTWQKLIDAVIGISEAVGLFVLYPGTDFTVGSTGDCVRLLQGYLAKISLSCSIPTPTIDGNFLSQTERTVSEFQKLLHLPVDGIVDETTWYAVISMRLMITRN